VKKKTANKKVPPFEKSRFDKEPAGVKEGSKEDEALDKKQGQMYKQTTGKDPEPAKSGVGMLDAAFKKGKGKGKK
jgi:hypothetical protein